MDYNLDTVYELIILAINLEELDKSLMINKPEFHYLKCKILILVFVVGKEILEAYNKTDKNVLQFYNNLVELKETTISYFEEYQDNKYYKDLLDKMKFI